MKTNKYQMNSNFYNKFRLFDVFCILFAIVFIVASIITTNVVFANSKGIDDTKSVEIYHHGKLLENRIINFKDVDDEIEVILSKEEYTDLLGDIHILVNKEKGVCIKEVECPNHYCEKQGWISYSGYPITCLPNDIYIIINNSSVDIDFVMR